MLVAESFQLLVIDGAPHVREYGRHEARFQKSVQKMLGHAPAELNDFMKQARDELCATVSDAFPRIECFVGSDHDKAVRFNLQIRPLPPITSKVHISSTSISLSEHPDIKGPNILAYARLNADAGGEVLLLDQNGFVLETTTTALLWWEGNRIMRVASKGRVASVTEAITLEIARRSGYETGEAMIHHQDLFNQQTEIWAVNALHGIRPVTNPDEARLKQFKDSYQSLLTRLKPKGLD